MDRGGSSIRTLPRSGDAGSMGLTSFMVDIAGALVSPRMSTPKLDRPRGRTMAGASGEEVVEGELSQCDAIPAKLTCGRDHELRTKGKKEKKDKGRLTRGPSDGQFTNFYFFPCLRSSDPPIPPFDSTLGADHRAWRDVHHRRDRCTTLVSGNESCTCVPSVRIPLAIRPAALSRRLSCNAARESRPGSTRPSVD